MADLVVRSLGIPAELHPALYGKSRPEQIEIMAEWATNEVCPQDASLEARAIQKHLFLVAFKLLDDDDKHVRLKAWLKLSDTVGYKRRVPHPLSRIPESLTPHRERGRAWKYLEAK